MYYIYIYLFIYLFIYVSVYTYIYIYIYVCICIYVYIYIYIYIYLYLFPKHIVCKGIIYFSRAGERIPWTQIGCPGIPWSPVVGSEHNGLLAWRFPNTVVSL